MERPALGGRQGLPGLSPCPNNKTKRQPQPCKLDLPGSQPASTTASAAIGAAAAAAAAAPAHQLRRQAGQLVVCVEGGAAGQAVLKLLEQRQPCGSTRGVLLEESLANDATPLQAGPRIHPLPQASSWHGVCTARQAAAAAPARHAAAAAAHPAPRPGWPAWCPPGGALAAGRPTCAAQPSGRLSPRAQRAGRGGQALGVSLLLGQAGRQAGRKAGREGSGRGHPRTAMHTSCIRWPHLIHVA